jgi:hypothetical protein
MSDGMFQGQEVTPRDGTVRNSTSLGGTDCAGSHPFGQLQLQEASIARTTLEAGSRNDAQAAVPRVRPRSFHHISYSYLEQKITLSDCISWKQDQRLRQSVRRGAPSDLL